MKSFILTLTLLTSFSLASAQKDFYVNRWSDVYRYELKGLTTSALKVVDTIYARSKKEKNVQEFTKSLIYQSKFAMTLQERSEVAIVEKFKKEIAEATTPQKNILESMLAHIYWEYFQQNRWRYYERSKTSATVNTGNFTTWDATGVFREVHMHFQNSLQNADQIQKMQLESINEILALADKSQRYRPTLYDFLAHNALDFYSKDDASITKPVKEFEIRGEEYFTDFENIKLTSPDSLSPELHALKIYQDLLRFHKQRKDTTAYMDVAIDRIQYTVAHGTFPDSRESLMNSFKTLRNEYARHKASAAAIYEIAKLLDKEGNEYSREKPELQFRKTEALALCQEAIRKFPGSEGAKRCSILRENILAQKLAIRAQRFTPANTYGILRVEYSNIDSIYFRAYNVTGLFTNEHLEHTDDSILYHVLNNATAVFLWKAGLKNLKD
jgi:hypothetical protein